jgi:MFS transporter, PHS family, inorganic phosphate transporter
MFYANTLFQPMVLSSAFGLTETVTSTARDSAMIALMALPGYVVSIATVGRQSPRYIQLQGFFLMAVLYAVMALSFHDAPRWLLIMLYGATFFCSNYGPNSTTFMLPSITFSRPCRSTLNGFCAACGKVGALVGTIVFGTFSNGQAVLLWCAGLSLVGWCMTYGCVVDSDDDELPEEEEERVPMKVVLSRASIFDWHE